MRLKYISIVTIVTAVTVATAALYFQGRADRFTYHYENVLGTSMDLTVLTASEQAARSAGAAALASIDHDAKILSGYDATSEFSRWFRTRDEAVPVSPELFDVLSMFDTWRVRTGGALDASAETASQVWQHAVTLQRVPTDAELRAAIDAIKQPHWRLDASSRTATHLDRTPIILNSFTKSYIIDRAVSAALASPGTKAVVVNIGGDLVTRGNWTETVSIIDPLDNADNAEPLMRVAVRDRAVATSGSYRRGFDIAGRHYSHIVDPRTAQPTSQVISATVVAAKAADAGALATAFCVLSPTDSQRLAATVPGAQFLLVLADGQRVPSAGWLAQSAKPAPRLNVPSPMTTVLASEQTGHADFELAVDVEFGRPTGRAERPYLAVWIEDADKFPIRTLTILYREARYLPELRAWYRDDRLRAMAEGTEIIGSVSSATRSPGKYTFKWDMKDQQGKLVKPGPYTVCIEAAREHGTYQLMRQSMDFSGKATQIQVPTNGGIEITSAALDYHKLAGQ